MIKAITLNNIQRKIFLLTGDLIIIVLALYLLFGYGLKNKDLQDYNWVLSFIGVVFFAVLAYVLDLYNLEKASKTRRILPLSLFVGLIFPQMVLLIIIFSINPVVDRIYLMLFLIIPSIFISLWRVICSRFFISSPFQKKVVFIYDNNEMEKNKERVKIIEGVNMVNGYNVKLTINANGNNEIYAKEFFKQAIDKIDIIIIDVNNNESISKNTKKFLSKSLGQGIEVQTFISFYENTFEALLIDLKNNSFYELIKLQNNTKNFSHNFFSFVIDLFLSIFFGIFFIISIPFVFVLNHFLNKGPLFYSQKRVGKNGKHFNILKYRSMVVDAEKDKIKMSIKNDHRVTPFGKVLRKFRIDELPQIISIIKQEMTFIGPRPERVIFVDQLNEITPYYNIRHIIKPGITGWAQVKYKYGEDFKDSINKLEYDLYYIKKKSITLDIRILFKTITTIIFSRGV